MKAKGRICVTGGVIVLGVGVAEGQVTVTGDAFVGEYPTRVDLAVRRKLHVCGSTDIQRDVTPDPSDRVGRCQWCCMLVAGWGRFLGYAGSMFAIQDVLLYGVGGMGPTSPLRESEPTLWP